jgi:Photosynthesis system II assembly factor YCF48
MAPRDDNKAMDGLLRRSLARDRAAANTCPDPDILSAYSERSLDADEMERQEQHFSECARCREQLVAIARADNIAEIPTNQVVKDAAVAAAPLARAIRPAATQAPEELARARRFDWRWLAPVAAAILLVVFAYERHGTHLGRPLISTNQVAMSKPEALPPADLVDQDSNPPHLSEPKRVPAESRAKSNGRVPSAAPPLARRESPPMARNYTAAPPMRDQGANQLDELGSNYEIPNALKKRAEAAVSNHLEKSAPSELDIFRTAKDKADSAPSATTPGAAPTPGATATTRAETTQSGTRAGAGGQRSIVGGMLNDRKQMQTSADAMGTVASEAVATELPAPVIQTPDVGVQYRIAGAGVVERSDDGGATWQGQRVMAKAEILAGAAPSVNVCWLVGRGGIVLMTNDGKNWKKVPSATTLDLVSVTASDAMFATITAADGRKFSTRNGGMTWEILK